MSASTSKADRDATVFIDGTHANVFIDGQLVRHLELDPTRRYQPTGRTTRRPPAEPAT